MYLSYTYIHSVSAESIPDNQQSLSSWIFNIQHIDSVPKLAVAQH